MSFTFSEFSEKATISIATSNAWLNIWSGAVRSGKTIASIVRWIYYILDAPPGLLMMVGKTVESLQTNILDILQDIVGNSYKKRGLNRIQVFDRIIKLVGANDERSEQKIRGSTLAGVYCDEITIYPHSFFKMLLSRLSIKNAKLFGTTNPDSPYHWFYTDFIESSKEYLQEKFGEKTDISKCVNMKLFHFDINDNLALTEEYKENLKNSLKGLFYKRFVLGVWCIAEGIIYSSFNKEKHVFKDNINNVDKFYVGVDYGVVNPFCALLIARKDDKFYCIKEFYHDSKKNGQKTNSWYALQLKIFLENYNISNIFIDPSASSLKSELNSLSISTSNAENDVINGIQYISSLIDSNKLFIHEDCKNTIREIESYSWDEKSVLKGIDKPCKINDHCLDALRYGIYSTYYKAFGDLKDIKVFGSFNKNYKDLY